jgi:ABC-type antimicrobial peptide transport system permease subunit
MTAWLRYVLRHLARQRLRTASGAVGVFITLALLTALEVGLDSVSGSYTDLVALQAGKADLIVTAPGGQWYRPEPFDPGPARAILGRHPELRGLSPRWYAVVQVRSGGTVADAFLIGLDPAAERQLDLWGVRPEPTLGTGRCAVSSALARRLGASAGRRVTLTAGGSEIEAEIEALIERQLLLPQEIRDFILVPEATSRTLVGESQRVHALAATLANPTAFYDSRDLQASVRRLKDTGESLATELGPDFDVRLPKAEALTAFRNFAAPLRAIFGVFALLALAIAGLLLYSIVSVAVEERIREYGILRTLGGRAGDIVRLVLGESILLCVAGVVPGVLAGLVLARLLVAIVGLALHAAPGSLPLAASLAQLGWPLLAGVVLAVGAALVPAVQATRRPIVDALDPFRRGQIPGADPRDPNRRRPLVLVGLALSALSVVVFFVLPSAFLSGNNSLIGTVILTLLVTILLGFTLVATGVLPVVERIVLRLLETVLGPPAELAARNLDRHRRRNLTTALMFVLSVALVIFVASLVVLFSRTAAVMVEHFNGADLRLETDDPEARGLKSELGAVSGVEAVSPVLALRHRGRQGTAYEAVLSDLVGLKHLWLVPYGVDADLTRAMYTNHVRYAEGGAADLARVAAYTGPDAGRSKGAPNSPEPAPAVLSLAAARFLEVNVGDPVQLTFQLGAERRSARFTVVAVCATFPGFDTFRARVANAIGSGLLVPRSSFEALTHGAPDEALQVRYFLRVAAGADARKAAADLRDRYDLRFRFGVKAAVEQQQAAQAIYWTTQVFFGLLLAAAVAIAVFALIAAMATSVLERRWEIGLLKALGLRRSQLFRMFLSEALGLTLAAGAVGGAIGFVLAGLFVVEAGQLAEIPVAFALPYVTFLATFLVSLLSGALAAHLPTRHLLAKTPGEIMRLNA